MWLMKRYIRLNNTPLFKREKIPILKYQDVLNSKQMIQKYPEIKMFANDDDACLYVEEHGDVVIHPLIRNEQNQRLYPMIDNMVETLTPLISSVDETGTPLVKMGRHAQLLFKKLFLVLITKSEMETKRPQDSYYGYTPINHYYRSDLLEEFSRLMYGIAPQSIHYNIDRLFLLETVRIYLENFYFIKNEKTYAYRHTTPFKNMRFDIIDMKHTADGDYRIFKTPVLKVTYKDSRLNINESFLHSSPRYVPKVEEQELR